VRKTVSSFLAGLITLLVLPTVLAAPAQAADRKFSCSVSGTFTVSDTRVTGNTNCIGEIVIPAKVTHINSYVFFDAAGITGITFASGSKLENIGEMAFYNTKITSIVLPSGLKSLEWGPFRNTGVKTISIPGTVTQLANGSFFGGPENVIFESRVATSLNIGDVSFTDPLSAVRSVKFKGPNQLQLDTSPGAVDADVSLGWSTTSNGPLVSFPLANTNPGDLTLYAKLTPNAGVALVPCSMGGFFKVVTGVATESSFDCAGEITIPADVRELRSSGGPYAGVFANKNITKVTFAPGGVISTIGSNAFEGTKITTISIPASVTGMGGVGGGAFYRSDLESVTFEGPADAWWLAYAGSFEGAPKLNSITFTAEFGSIGMPVVQKEDYRQLGWSTSPGGEVLATYPTTAYSEFSVPAGTTLYNVMVPVVVNEIDCSLSGSFTQRDSVVTASTADCAGEITIPADVTQVNDSVFDRRGLTKVAFAANSQLKTIARDAFSYNNITDLVLPENLEYVGWNAFAGLKATSIVIPGKLDQILPNSFGSGSLEEVTFASRVSKQWGGSPFPAFNNNSKLSSLTFVGKHQLYWWYHALDTKFDPDDEKVERGGYKWEGWSAVKGGPIVRSWAPLTNNQVTTVLYPNWSTNTFIASFESNGGTPVAPSTIVGGQIQMPAAPAKVGYTFLGWTPYQDGGGDVETGYWPYDGDYTFGAKWSANTYAANLNTKGGTQLSPASFRTGGVIEEWDLATPTRNCSELAGWSATDGGAAIEFPYSPGVMSAITLFAKWTPAPCAVTAGAAENSQVVSVPSGTSEAVIPATEALPTVKLNLAGASGAAVVTVAPVSNPTAPSSTPFRISETTKIVDINVTGITGSVTVCLDGESTDALFHYTGGRWLELPQRSYANGQVCGVTSNFSPFAAAAPAPIAPVVNNPAPVVNNPAPVVDNAAALAAADLAARTVSAKKTLAPNALAKQVGVKVVSPKAKVTMTVAGSSKKNCAVVAGKLKTLKAGNCVVSFTVQEPKPAKGKQPKATKTTKTLVVK